MMRFVVCCCLSLAYVFMLLISWNTQLVAAEYMKLEVNHINNVYVTKISLGTPAKALSLVFDTTTDLIWFMCGVNEGQSMPPVPFPSNATMPAGDPIPEGLRLDLSYNLNHTSNFSYIFCNSPLCPNDFKNADSMCNDVTLCTGAPVDSQVIMYESMDVLNMISSADLTFACAPFISADNYLAAGVLGLGRGNQSFVSQLGFMYDNFFSYCLLLDTTNSSGYFALGKGNPNTINNSTIYTTTPLIADPRLYLIRMTSVTINGTRVSIDSSESNTALDPGTFFTTLPTKAYTTMRKIVLDMNVNKEFGSYSDLPSDIICFDTSQEAGGPVEIPSIEITFGGNATIVLDRSAIIYDADENVSCLGFHMWDIMSDAHARFGSMQQAQTDVLIDLGNQSVGFRQNTACATAN